MRIAVINETSAGDKNGEIVKAVKSSGEGVVESVANIGMTQRGGSPELQYTHTGLLSALVLHAGVADFVVGGCGTGQGYLNAVTQYPGVVCGHILSPLDAWLFAQINGGNCISLALNQGYGWAGDVNLEFIFERLFSVQFGCGYPPHREEPQRQSRDLLTQISRATHVAMAEVVQNLPPGFVRETLTFPGVSAIFDYRRTGDEALDNALTKIMEGHK